MTWLGVRAVRRAAFLCSLAVPGALGCAGDETSSAKPPAPTGALAFDVDGVLTLSPGQVLDVAILVPPGHARASAWLEGDYLDASLTSGEVAVTDGRATVTVRASTTPATFALHAKSDNLEARLDVSVGANGFGSVSVTTSYAGHRTQGEVVGSAFLRATCNDLETAPLRDGAPRVAGSIGQPILLSRIPAGEKLAVSVRIGHYASGCIDLEPLLASATRPIDLAILDRAMALDATALEAVFTFEPAPDDRVAWDAMLANAAQETLGVFTPAGVPESTVLLDAMSDAAPSASAAAFGDTRTQNGYDGKVTTWLGAHPPGLHDRAAAYLAAGRPDAFGDLRLHIDASGQPGLAKLTPEAFASFSAADVGAVPLAAFGWSADPDDRVHLSGGIALPPSKLAARAADGRAADAISGAKTVADALAGQIDCAGLASSLVGSGTSYPGCDAACTAALCRTALTSQWTLAAAASAAAPAQLAVSVSAQASVGDQAEPVSFDGTWVATVQAPGSSSFGLKGTATATSATATP